ncbi:Guanylate kinase [Richelia intracellularis HM01]|uniref:guanylate kinase n=1 Tax=Richelia intracellularis TaxID=1164990 RepID=UPI0002B4FD0A|nr:guanylate kinase [Richelia intracellularis]CCH65982.1 Guanylate kinase [Richelia intracellularis HM01]
MRSRAQDSDDAVAQRLICSQREIKAAHEFDLQIVNDNLGATLKKLESALFRPSNS